MGLILQNDVLFSCHIKYYSIKTIIYRRIAIFVDTLKIYNFQISKGV
jgi:hypothetical protein